MRTHDAATSGVIRSADIYASGTYSIHTVCHMPLWGVYHMPPRFVRCLPARIFVCVRRVLYAHGQDILTVRDKISYVNLKSRVSAAM